MSLRRIVRSRGGVEDGWTLRIDPANAFHLSQLAKQAVGSFPPRAGDDRTETEKLRDMFGALCAEMALHEKTGLTWFAGLHDFSSPTDVGPYQVKSTRNARYHLFVPLDAPADMPYLLAIVRGFEVKFCGWRLAGNAKDVAKDRSHPRVRGDVWWVAQEDLHPMASLRVERIRATAPKPAAVNRLPEFKGKPANALVLALAARLSEGLEQGKVQSEQLQGLPRYKRVKFEEWSRGLRSGMRVRHAYFGIGMISGLSNYRGKILVAITFGGQTRNLNPDDHRIELVDASADVTERYVESANDDPLKTGVTVIHPKYGRGMVYRTISKKGVERVVIDFETIGRKTLTRTLHRLEVVPPDR